MGDSAVSCWARSPPKILHDADCPVWTGVHLEKAPPLEKIEFRNFVCAVSSESYAHKVLEAASEFAKEFSAKLTVVHAIPVGGEAVASRHEIEQAVQPIAPGTEVVIEHGEVAGVVAAEAARSKADLLIIGRGPAPGVFGRLREHAYPIIRQSPCPVISV